MKKILSLTLCILLFASAVFPASAEVVVQEEDYYRDGDYLFEIIEGSEISITYYTGTQSTPIIPSSIGGLPVTQIGERAFFGNDIKDVTIPDGVTHIAEEAFYNCQSLESVTLPKSLESMGTAIFRFCQNLKTVTFSGADTSPILGKYTFYACNSLESVNIPEGVTNIPEGMFAFCESLENITLPQNTESVYDYAFYGSGLRSITLPESLDYIGEMAFADCSSLDEITAIGDSCNAVSDNSFSGTPAGNPFDKTPDQDNTTSTYEKYQESIKPENNYGLTKNVDTGKFLQAWNWSFNNITALMEEIAEQGFSTILVSPPNELKMATKGAKVSEPLVNGVEPNGWWMLYQPAGFQLNESEDNALGTKSEFIQMCQEARKYGIKIIVDVVANHLGSSDDHTGVYVNDSTDPMDHVTDRAWEFEPEILEAKAFHSPYAECTYKERYSDGYSDYEIEESLTQHSISGCPDLATEMQVVQNAILEYLEELVEAGASGFRFDSAENIETVHDTYFPSDFWEDTIFKLREFSDYKYYAYGDIYMTCGDGRPFSEYTELMDVTDYSTYWGIKDAVYYQGEVGNAIPEYPNSDFTSENAVLMNEYHTTYMDGGTSPLTAQERNKIWALIGSRQNITGGYFARPDDSTADTRTEVNNICSNITLGDANITAWANTEVQAVNRFGNFFVNADEAVSVQNNIAMVERFDGTDFGATLVNLSGTTMDISVTTSALIDGSYIDAITGNEFVVTNGLLTGQIGSTGIACIYSLAPYETDNPFSFAKKEIAAIGANSTDSGIITEDDFLVATTFENVVIREKDLLAEVGAQVEADLGAKMTAATNVRLRGDANCDNQINIRDATTIQKYTASIIKINNSGFCYKNADVDADGKVNVKDATLIQKHLVGMAQIPTGPIQSA